MKWFTFNRIDPYKLPQRLPPSDGLLIIDNVLDHNTSTLLDSIHLLRTQILQVAKVYLRDDLTQFSINIRGFSSVENPIKNPHQNRLGVS